MMNPKPTTTLPHHQLIAYQLSIELLSLFRSLRKSLVSCSLNLAEGAGRRSRADKSRVYAIALGELCEAAAALEIDSVARGKLAELSEF